MNKKQYSTAMLDVILFENGDIVTASGGNPDPKDTDWGGTQEW